MTRHKFIKVRVTESEQDHANRVAAAANKDLSAIVREAIAKLAKKYGVKA